MRAAAQKAKTGFKPLMERVLSSRQITRVDYLRLTSSLLSNHRITEEERTQISRIFDYIQTGKLTLID